jgi:hypothetical protein
VRGHGGFEIVPRADGNEPSGFAREQRGDCARIVAQERHSGEDQRTGIDQRAADASGLVLLVSEGSQSGFVYGSGTPIRRRQDAGLEEDLATDGYVAVVLALQFEP